MALKTHEQFAEDLGLANPSVLPVGTYVHSKSPILV